MKQFVFLFFSFILFYSSPSSGQDFTYSPKNPAFGGNPYNYSWMLSSAQAQDTYKAKTTDSDPYSYYNSNPVDDFAESLNRQILSQLSRQIVARQFGEDALAEGSYIMGDYQIDIGNDSGGLNITILDNTTGATTTVSVPISKQRKYKYISYAEKMIFRGVLFSLVCGIMLSCSPYFHQPLGPRQAELGRNTDEKELLDLPEPKEKIVVAVYKFRDQTGQYKASETGASWSTAVTQGATNILIRALEESGWFIPIERENISNLLNERKIIRSSREQYEGGANVLLPPLLFAGVLIEGGIVSYETNIFTGGAGVRYFGTDASAQYREDRVTIYLRAVSTSNGKILKTIYTTKSILSQEVSMGVFRYVKFKRLLEAETGFTYNEPTEMAITEAIEKGIQGLIIEGVMDNLWALNDSSQLNSTHFQEYIKEKSENLGEDLIGRKYEQNYRKKSYVSITSSGQFFNGDYSTSKIRPGGTISVGRGLNKSFFLEAGFGPQFLHIQDIYSSQEYGGNLNLLFMANTFDKYSPYLKAGVGTMFDFGGKIGVSDKKLLPYLSFGIGNEFLFTNRIGITGGAFFNQFLFDSFDGSSAGTFNDSFWGFDLGLRMYF